MTDYPIVTQLPLWTFPLNARKTLQKQPDLHTLWQFFETLPSTIQESPTIKRCLDLLAPLDWGHVPERNLARNWGQATIPYATLMAAELIRLNEHVPSMAALHRFLLEHAGFISLLGFPLAIDPTSALGFHPLASLPSARHLTYLLRQLPAATVQFLLADSVRLILAELDTRRLLPIECISLDTKHILAWVKENNPKAYVTERYNKSRQPAGRWPWLRREYSIQTVLNAPKWTSYSKLIIPT